MNLEYGIACTICSTIGSFVGTIMIQKIIEKYRRFSFLVFVLGGVLLVSTIMIPIHSIMSITKEIKQGLDNVWSFNYPC